MAQSGKKENKPGSSFKYYINIGDMAQLGNICQKEKRVKCNMAQSGKRKSTM